MSHSPHTAKTRPAPLVEPLVHSIVAQALLEDLSGGDITSEATVPADARATGTAYAKSPLVACGAQVARAAFEGVDPKLEFEVCVPDGTWVNPGKPLWVVTGSARSILAGERTALNFVQRMSGISTMAHNYVREVPVGCSTRIVDTRKTTPGLRCLERYAVRAGGAHNHRDDLGSAVLIKDNHIIAAGGITEAVRRAKQYAAHTTRIELEVESLFQLNEALQAGVDIIMLDNFAPSELTTAVDRCRGKALVEMSGNVTLERIAELARAGADVISVGALTHSAPAADISLSIETHSQHS